MAEALKEINGAASLFSTVVDTAAHLLQQPETTLSQAKALGAKLAEEAEKFRSVVWPDHSRKVATHRDRHGPGDW